MVADRGEDVVAPLADGQLRRVGDDGHGSAPLLDACLGGGHLGGEPVEVAAARLGVLRPDGSVETAPQPTLVTQRQTRQPTPKVGLPRCHCDSSVLLAAAVAVALRRGYRAQPWLRPPHTFTHSDEIAVEPRWRASGTSEPSATRSWPGLSSDDNRTGSRWLPGGLPEGTQSGLLLGWLTT